MIDQFPLKLFQQGKCLLVEVIDRADTNGQIQLILKIFLHPLIGTQLILRQISCVCLDTSTILYRLGDMLRKWCDKSFAICIDQYLCPIFGDNTADINIEHLASIKSCFPIFAGRQSGSINLIWSNRPGHSS